MKNRNLLISGLAAAIALAFVGVAQAGLVAHWTMDDPAGSSIVSDVLGHDGVPNYAVGDSVVFGAPGATPSSGTAAAFSNGVVHVPYDAALNPESFTFAAWAKANSSGGYQAVVTSRHDAFPALAGYILYNDGGGNWSFWTGRDGGWDVTGGPAVAVDTWTHLAISFDADSSAKTLYVNGVPTSGAGEYVPNAVQNLHLGAGNDWGTQYFFDGTLDDAGLWNAALTEADVTTIMNSGAAAVPTNQVAHWALDEPAGVMGAGAVVDSVGGHNGDLPGAPFALGLPGANANTGTSADFSNVSVDVAHGADLNPDSFTFTAWVKPESASGYQALVTNRHDQGPGQNLQGFILYNASGNWQFWTGDGDPGWPSISGPNAVIGEWQHLAISFDADTNTKSLYVDGVLAASATDQGYVPNDLRDLHIGGGGDMGTDFRFDGMIDDVGLWDYALTQSQIAGVMVSGVPEPSSIALLITAMLGLIGWCVRRKR